VVPINFVSIVLFLVFMTPGFTWVRVEERERPRPDRTQLLEAAGSLSIGTIASVLAGAAVAAAGAKLEAFLTLPSGCRR